MSSKYIPDYWQPKLAAAAPDLPTAKLVAWITEESGGNPASLGSKFEVGIFQIDLQDGPVAGIPEGTLDSLHSNFAVSPTSQVLARDLTDDEEALQVSTGIKYVKQCLHRAQAASPDWSDQDTWCLTKMIHALPAMVADLLPAAAEAGYATSWAMYKEYGGIVPQNSLPPSLVPYFPLDRFFANAEVVGNA